MLCHSKSSLNNFLMLKRFMSSIHDMKIEYLKRTFEEFNVPSTDSFVNQTCGSFKKSAVLVPISVRMERNQKGHFHQQSYFTLSKRTEHLKRHKGQVCFPGGMCDQNDKNEFETALREAHEEIGINREDISHVAQMYPMITSTKTLVTPIIAFFDDAFYEPKINKNEVDLVFRLPTSRFISKIDHKHESYKIPTTDDEYFVHYFKDKVDGVEITTWGVTALICILASSIIHSRAPQFQLDPQYTFDKDKINDYLKHSLIRNIERINYYEKNKSEKK